MANETITRQYLDMEGLSTYDTLLKTKISNDINTAKYNDTELKEEIGVISNLETTAKTDLVSAINEVKGSIDDANIASKITVDTSTTTDGMAKSYIIKQNGVNITTIDIPKDMVVSSGIVEVNPEGYAEGTYLVLTLANTNSDKVYINVGTLVDIYTAQASATQVQLAINSVTREISATIVAESITATELATDAVTTVKIADANVTKAKLATDVQTSLSKADTAVQSVTAGVANGTIAVDGVDVTITGLGSAAYADSTTYEIAGTVQALADGQVATNKNNIETLQNKVASLESVEYTAITAEQINSLFTSN